jgi:hypothetical protein
MSTRRIEARNLAAQLHYAGRGSPPSSHPSSAISNAYPGRIDGWTSGTCIGRSLAVPAGHAICAAAAAITR